MSTMALLYITMFTRAATAENEKPNVRNMTVTNEKPRIGSISSEAPYASVFNRDQLSIIAIRNLLSEITNQANENNDKVCAWRYGNRVENPCNVPVTELMSEGLNKTLASRGFGRFFPTCASDIVLDSDRSSTLLNDYFTAVNRKADFLLQKLKPKLSKEHAELFKQAYTYERFRFRSHLHKCTLNHVTALRNSSIWAITVSLTNEPSTKFVKDRKRIYAHENVYVKDGLLKPLYELTNGSNSTTSWSEWGGIPSTSRFLTISPVEQNVAVVAALEQREHVRHQAEDMLTSVNILILLIPVSTALVPVALFAETNTLTLIAYTLLTDFIAALPLAVKGVELMIYSRFRLSAARLRIFQDSNNNDAGAAEIWHAKCESRYHIFLKGIIFLSAALVLSAIGCSLELIARKKLKAYKHSYSLRNLRAKETILRHRLINSCNPCTEECLRSCSVGSRPITESSLGVGTQFNCDYDLMEDLLLA